MHQRAAAAYQSDSDAKPFIHLQSTEVKKILAPPHITLSILVFYYCNFVNREKMGIFMSYIIITNIGLVGTTVTQLQ